MNYNFNGDILVNGQPISAGGGVYLHRVYVGTNSCVDIILTTNTPLTNGTFAKYLYDNGYTIAERCKPYNFYGSMFSVNSATKLRGTFGIFASGETANTLSTVRMDLDIVVGTGFSNISTNTFAYSSTITDVVTEL